MWVNIIGDYSCVVVAKMSSYPQRMWRVVDDGLVEELQILYQWLLILIFGCIKNIVLSKIVGKLEMKINSWHTLFNNINVCILCIEDRNKILTFDIFTVLVGL